MGIQRVKTVQWKQREGALQLKVLMIMTGKYTVSYGNSKKGTYLDVAGRRRRRVSGGMDKRLQKVMIPMLL